MEKRQCCWSFYADLSISAAPSISDKACQIAWTFPNSVSSFIEVQTVDVILSWGFFVCAHFRQIKTHPCQRNTNRQRHQSLVSVRNEAGFLSAALWMSCYRCRRLLKASWQTCHTRTGFNTSDTVFERSSQVIWLKEANVIVYDWRYRRNKLLLMLYAIHVSGFDLVFCSWMLRWMSC